MEELIRGFIDSPLSRDYDEVQAREEKLRSFCEANVQVFSFEHIDRSLRHEFIRCLMDDLNMQDEESKKCYSLSYVASCLEALRVLSRDRSNLDDMVTESSCLTLLKLSGLYYDANGQRSGELNVDLDAVIEKAVVVVEALKCICNLVYQDREFRQYAMKYNCTEATCSRLVWFHHPGLPQGVKFFDLRLLFVVTALEPNERTTALHSNAVQLLTSALSRVVPGSEERKALLKQEMAVKDGPSESILPPRCTLPEISLEQDNIELFGEILKVLFNVTINISQDQTDEEMQRPCNSLIFILRHMLIKCSEVLKQPRNLQNNIINTLINLPYSSYKLLYWEIPKSNAKEIIKKFEAKHNRNEHPIVFEVFNVEAVQILLRILDQRLIDNINLKETLSPLLSVLTMVSRQNRIIRKYLRQEILPPLGYVGTEKPEELKTIRGRLVRHLTSAIHELKESVGEFLFVLCKENVPRLIKYAGYGNAAGFLADHGLMAGNNEDLAGSYSTDDGESETEEYERIKDQIDPMTGAQADSTVENPLDKMTAEEKEAEAEKLANLLSKLNEKGLVKAAGIGPDGKPVEIEPNEK